MQPTLVGIEIGGTKLQVVAGDASGTVMERQRFQVDAAQGADGIRAALRESLLALATRWNPSAVGVGFGGPVDHRTGQVCCSHQVQGWSEFPLGAWLEELLQRPVRVENDANTAALAEARCGAGKDGNPVFYVTLGSGVGGGCVVNQHIYHGALPGEAEIGHVRLDRTGTIVEDRCSGWAVDRRIRELARLHSDTPLATRARQDPGHEARHLAPALEAGDPTARQLVSEVAGDLAFALSHVTHLLHPQVLILGGGLSLIGGPLVQAVAQALPGFLMTAFQPGPKIRLAALKEDAVPTGALLLAANLHLSPNAQH